MVVLLIFIVVMIISQSSGPTPAQTLAGEDASLKTDAKAAVRASMRDPGSAQFRDVIVVRKQGSAVVCGSVNAKNGFGGYTGYRDFVARGPVVSVRASASDSKFVNLWNRVCVL